MSRNSDRTHTIHSLIRTAIAQNESVRLNVTSSSMYPLLSVGSIVVVQSKPFELLCCGDIVVVDQGEYWNTHRIIRIENYHCITKGDANWNFDLPVEFGSILGLVTMFEEGNGSWDLACFPWDRVNRLIGKLSRVEGAIMSWDGRSGGKTPVSKILIAALIRIYIKILLVAVKLVSKKKK